MRDFRRLGRHPVPVAKLTLQQVEVELCTEGASSEHEPGADLGTQGEDRERGRPWHGMLFVARDSCDRVIDARARLPPHVVKPAQLGKPVLAGLDKLFCL